MNACVIAAVTQAFLVRRDPRKMAFYRLLHDLLP